MKVALLGPGIISIPPPGWGAVEILIWDYYNALKYQGIQVNIINKIRKNSYEQSNLNSVYCRELIDEINNGKYDFVHIHYDCLFHIIPFLSCKTIGFTSHYPYINDKNYHSQDGFTNIFDFMVSNKTSINFVLAKKDYQYLLEEGAIENKLYLDPTDMHDLHILLVYRKPEIKSFYTAKNEADLLDYWDRITNALIRIESNITENDYTYYNTFVGIREEIMKIHQSYGGKC